ARHGAFLPGFRAGGFPWGFPSGHGCKPLRNLDSLSISVVLSVAYRNFEKPRGAPDPSEPTPGNRSFAAGRSMEEDAQGMANAEDPKTPSGGGAGVATTDRLEPGDPAGVKPLPRADPEPLHSHALQAP